MALAIWQRTIVDDEGNILAGASVEVRLESTGNLATLKSNRAGSSGAANPITADSNGFVQFYVSGGAYQIVATKDGLTKTWRYVGIGTACETDLPAGGYAARLVTAAGDVDVGATDVDLIINKTVGEATTVNCGPAADRNGAEIFIKDGKGDADSNPITPAFDGSETCDGNAGTAYQITTPYGFVRFAPLPDNSGYYCKAMAL